MDLRTGLGRDSLMFQETLKQRKVGSLYAKMIDQWNNLPIYLREIQQLATFKSKLKTFFFEEAFAEFL